jgi:hypothetical protein
VAAFASLGRVFDKKSEHNLDRMIRVAAADLTIFSKVALQLRKKAHISKAKAAAYVRDAYEVTSSLTDASRKCGRASSS